MSNNPQQLVDHLFRHESGKMIAVLSRIFGIHNLEMAEDVVQEAFLKAVQLWKFDQIPENPSGWLMQTARNKAIDIIRRRQNFGMYSKELALQLQTETENTVQQFFHDTEIADSQLQMIFACCHPSLKKEDQVALTLKIVSGFGIPEIARALLNNEATIQKRLFRAREFLKNENIQLEIPAGRELVRRLEMVHTILYLIFNEGYNSIKNDELIRKDICAEAMRLCLLLTEHQIGGQPSGFALLSLMCFQASRFDSRIDENNDIILLQKQDRSKWNRELIARGYQYLTRSSKGAAISIYHIESAIAAEHCLAKEFEDTNWTRMLELYDLLLKYKNSPIVSLNRAVVLSQTAGAAIAIENILKIDGLENLLESNYIYSAVLGDLYLKSGNSTEAQEHLLRAYGLTSSNAEKKLIGDKLRSI